MVVSWLTRASVNILHHSNEARILLDKVVNKSQAEAREQDRHEG